MEPHEEGAMNVNGWIRGAVTLAMVVLVAVVPVWASKGDIVPESAKDVTAKTVGKVTVGSVKTAEYTVDIGVSTGKGVLSINVKVHNTSDFPINLRPDCLKLESED